MKTILTTLKFLVFLFLLSSCVGQISPPLEEINSASRLGVESRERDRDAEDRIKRFFSGDSCEDLIEDKRRGETLECEEMCREVYRRRDSDECEELSEVAIEEIHELHEILENPDEDDLSDVELLVFENYLDINIEPFEDLIEDYSQRQAEETLIWILSDYDIFEIFEGEDDDFELLDELLKQFNNGGDIDKSELPELFNRSLGREDSLIEYLIDVGDEDVFDYLVFDYVEDILENGSCDNRISLDCFRVYCQIGRKLDREEQAELIDFRRFSDYIDDIINSGINKRNWSDKNIDDVEDVESSRDTKTWVDQLCGKIVTE